MEHTASYELVRRPQAAAIDSLAPSTRCALMAQGLYPKNFTLTGSRTVAWLKCDILIWCAARAAGATEEEIKELVNTLEANRKKIDWRMLAQEVA